VAGVRSVVGGLELLDQDEHVLGMEEPAATSDGDARDIELGRALARGDETVGVVVDGDLGAAGA